MKPFCYMSDVYEVALFTEQPTDPIYADMFPVYKKSDVAETIAAKDAEIAKWKAGVQDNLNARLDYQKTISELREEVARLKQDADRYRWLRLQQIDLDRPQVGVLNGGIFIGRIPHNVVLSEADADAAIDAAMKGGE